MSIVRVKDKSKTFDIKPSYICVENFVYVEQTSKNIITVKKFVYVRLLSKTLLMFNKPPKHTITVKKFVDVEQTSKTFNFKLLSKTCDLKTEVHLSTRSLKTSSEKKKTLFFLL